MKRYLIIPKKQPPFYTNYFSIENNFVDGMKVIDLHNDMFYIGGDWKLIEYDTL